MITAEELAAREQKGCPLLLTEIMERFDAIAHKRIAKIQQALGKPQRKG
jgi:hypothetical protein